MIDVGRRALISLAPALGLLLLARVVHADLGPAPTTKRVAFSFSITGLAKAPDRVLFAYPCTPFMETSAKEPVKIQDGVTVATAPESGACRIYAIARSDYDAWATLTPRATAETLLPKATKCTGGPTPISMVSARDPRDEIVETFEVTTLDATSCVISTRTPPATSPAPAPAPPTAKSRCSFTSGPNETSLAIGFATGALVFIAARRHRRRRALQVTRLPRKVCESSGRSRAPGADAG
jgi:hypothetical protein